MAVTYNPATNQIIIDGYTELAPCTFTDVYNADKAGTFSLHARIGIAATDGAPVAVDNALRPTDYVILGGASNDLYITVANWVNMTTATIRVTGTDRDGAAQTDDVVVNANGNFSTAKWFKTVTHTQVTVFTKSDAGSFDYDLTQNQWGVVWRQGTKQFQLDARLIIGAGWNDVAWFIDGNVQVVFSSGVAGASGVFRVEAGSGANKHCYLGTLDDAAKRIGSQGISLFSELTGAHTLFQSYGDTRALASHFACPDLVAFAGQFVVIDDYGGSIAMYHNIFSDNVKFILLEGADVYDQYITNARIGIDIATSTFEDIMIENVDWGLVNFAAWGLTVQEARIQSAATADFRMLTTTSDIHAIDCVCGWTITWEPGVNTGIIYREYTFNLQVVDATGTGIVGATVSMVDRLGAAVFSVVTDANGDIAEQTVEMGYYDVGNGNVIQPAGGGYTPHTVTISKAGYSPRTIVYTIDRPHVEVEKLGGAAPHGREYRRRRVPSLVSVLDEYE